MTHLTLRISSTFFQYYYNEEKNIMIKQKYKNGEFPIYISFNNVFVSFHFFPLQYQRYSQQIESALCTVVFDNSLTNEGWGLLSNSHPIVVTFKIDDIVKLFDNKDQNNSQQNEQNNSAISIECNPDYPLPYNITYKYLFPFEKLVYRNQQLGINNTCLVSLIKIFGVLFLKNKKRIFNENIEKCYYLYFANPNIKTFSNFYFALCDNSFNSSNEFDATQINNDSKYERQNIKGMIELMLDNKVVSIVENNKCLNIIPSENYVKQIRDEIIQTDGKKDPRLKKNNDKVKKRRKVKEYDQIVSYVEIFSDNQDRATKFILEEEMIDAEINSNEDGKNKFNIDNLHKIFIRSSLIEERDIDQAKIISLDENKAVNIDVGSDKDPLSFKFVYKNEISSSKDKNTLYECIKDNFFYRYLKEISDDDEDDSKNRKTQSGGQGTAEGKEEENDGGGSKKSKNADQGIVVEEEEEENDDDDNNSKNKSKKGDQGIAVEEEEEENDDDDNSNKKSKNKNKSKKGDHGIVLEEEEEVNDDDDDDDNSSSKKSKNKPQNGTQVNAAKESNDNNGSCIDDKYSIEFSEESNNLFAIERGKIPGLNLSAFPFRFNISQTLFIAASAHLRPLVELKKVQNRSINLSFYSQRNRVPAIVEEGDDKFLICDAYIKSGNYPLLKIKLDNDDDDDRETKVYIVWHFWKTASDLLVLKSMPTYGINMDEKEIVVKDSMMLDFVDEQPSIELIIASSISSNEKKIFLNDKKFLLH